MLDKNKITYAMVPIDGIVSIHTYIHTYIHVHHILIPDPIKTLVRKKEREREREGEREMMYGVEEPLRWYH